jgi:hypothetical protein
MAQFSANDLAEIFLNTLTGNPREYANYVSRNLGDDYENPIVYDITHSSPLIGAARQVLPNKLTDTKLGQWIVDQLPTNSDPKAISSRARQALESVPLGGYTQQELEQYRQARANDEQLRRSTVEIGQVPLADYKEVPVGDSNRAALTQAAGVVASDVATDGLRNIWWFLNAPQAIAQIAVMNALHTAGKEYKATDERVPLIKNRNLRLAATVPAVLGMSLAVGNASRQPGYKAALPSEVDPKQTVDPLGEFATRYFLGRTGGLLPYDEFVQERPDVSRSEYEQYKNYLFGNAMPLKATLDGIQGPEVTFMGKSIPVATGVLPAVAAVLGARYGAKRAAARLAGVDFKTGASTGPNRLQQAEALRQRLVDTRKDADAMDAHEAMIAAGRPQDSPINMAQAAYGRRQSKNEREVLKQSLLYSGGATAGTALLGPALESIRRAAKGRAEIEPEETEMLPTADLSSQRMR